jgi:DNA recombination protein RmuC
MEIILLIAGLIAGIAIGFLLANRKASATLQAEKEQFSRLDKELTTLKATSEAQLNAARQSLQEKIMDLEQQKSEFQKLQDEANNLNRQYATVNAQNKALQDKLDTQKAEIEELGKKFNLEFENLANRILESKTQKFTDLNKTNLNAILEPLGKNIEEFKKSVNDAYNTEAKERFSLGEQVKALADLNKTIGEEARNLTKALKGEAKTQGRWGEMILETILEKSGLRKGEEYFMEAQLTDENGNPLRSDSEGKKMRPDAVISYPDNRKVIIDSKVSLNAFTRLIEATEPDEQKKELNDHISAIKNHIIALSTKGYDDYDKALDFVMMFIPSEPAYIAALQGDPEIWNFAYDKRILLLSPTNLITSLKLIVDLWKREQHNQNAKAIAERGAKMYDKLVGFVDNLEDIGKYLEKANSSYNESYKQLKDGKDNLILQATKMKELGIKNKKSLPDKLVSDATLNELSESEE